MKTRKVLIGLLLFSFFSFSFAFDISFPGKTDQKYSPNRKYELVNVDANTDADADVLGAYHALFIRDLKKGARKK